MLFLLIIEKQYFFSLFTFLFALLSDLRAFKLELYSFFLVFFFWLMK